MNKTIFAALAASSMSLAACSTTARDDDTLRSAGTGAAVGAAAGAGLGAVVGGLSPIAGAAIGAAVGGVAGAVWADNDRDGRADGYVREGQYSQGVPAGYNADGTRNCRSSTLSGAATGAGVGAAGGAGIGAIAGGLGVLEGAAIGAVVGGIAGAVWADNDRDGCVDGYVREGRYYEGVPQQQQPAPYQYQAPLRRGERG